MCLGEFPLLDFVHCNAAHTYGALFAENGDRALQVSRIGEHRDIYRAQCARAPPYAHSCGVFNLDVPSQRRDISLHALDRTDHPVHQVHVVACLIHERAAVELPGATPARAVVVRLRPRPEDVDGSHENAPEPTLIYGALQQLQRGVTAILLHYEEVHASLVALADHAQPIAPARGHRLLCDDMPTTVRRLDCLRGMQPARRA